MYPVLYLSRLQGVLELFGAKKLSETSKLTYQSGSEKLKLKTFLITWAFTNSKKKKKGLTCSLIGESEAEFTGLSVLYVFMCRSESVSKSYKTKAGKSSEMYRKNFSIN